MCHTMTYIFTRSLAVAWRDARDCQGDAAVLLRGTSIVGIMTNHEGAQERQCSMKLQPLPVDLSVSCYQPAVGGQASKQSHGVLTRVSVWLPDSAYLPLPLSSEL